MNSKGLSPHYFSYHPNKEVRELYVHAIINNMAIGMAYIFEPIFLFSQGYGYISILWFYVMVYCWYTLLVGIGGKVASRLGFKHAIFISIIFYALYWLSLAFIHEVPILFFVAPFMYALQKSFFWPAFNTEAALNFVNRQRGREVGALFSLIEVSYIVGPIIGGLISSKLGFLPLFGIAAVLMLISVYPLFRSPDIHIKHEFQFKDLWAIIKERLSNFFGYWGYAEDLMIQSLWPVFLFSIIQGYFAIGIVMTLSAVLSSLIMLGLGKFIDEHKNENLTRVMGIVYGSSWFVRGLVKSIPTVLGMEFISRALKGLTNVSLMSLTYEIAASKDKNYAIAYMVFVEFSLSIAKVITALGCIAILWYTGSIFWAFALAGWLTMFYGLLKR